MRSPARRWRRAALRGGAASPGDVQAVLDAAPGERLRAWARDADGDVLVATDQGLWGYGERLAWIEIDHVTWAGGLLTVLAIDGERRSVALTEPRDLPGAVRGLVDASMLTSRAVPLLPDGRGVTVVGRRRPTGEVLWRLRFDPGVPPDDASLRARAEQALARIREELGV